jgi:hypothetical protein
MHYPRARRYEDDNGREKRVDRSALRIIARWVAEHDRAPAVEPSRWTDPDATESDPLVDRDFFVLDPRRGTERLTK